MANPYEHVMDYITSFPFDSEKSKDQHIKALEDAEDDAKKINLLLTKEEKEIIMSFTLNSTEFNQYLQDGIDINDPQNAKAKQLSEIFKKIPVKNRITYRGTSYDKTQHNPNFEVGDYVYDGRFTSTSFSIQTAQTYASWNFGENIQPVVFAFETNNGMNVMENTYFPQEAEVVLNPKAQFQVKSMRTVDGIQYMLMKEIDYQPGGEFTIKQLYTGKPLPCTEV